MVPWNRRVQQRGKVMADFLNEVRREIGARIDELRPLVEEYERLEAAAAALDNATTTPAATQRRASRRHTAASSSTPPATGRLGFAVGAVGMGV